MGAPGIIPKANSISPTPGVVRTPASNFYFSWSNDTVLLWNRSMPSQRQNFREGTWIWTIRMEILILTNRPRRKARGLFMSGLARSQDTILSTIVSSRQACWKKRSAWANSTGQLLQISKLTMWTSASMKKENRYSTWSPNVIFFP